jgi:hypothetical protein
MNIANAAIAPLLSDTTLFDTGDLSVIRAFCKTASIGHSTRFSPDKAQQHEIPYHFFRALKRSRKRK